MARMHARKKGSSGSNRPYLTDNPDWVPLRENEIEETVLKLQGDGFSKAQIGIKLRDQYGIPSVKLATGRSIQDILEENDIKPRLPEDLSNLIRRAVNLSEHMERNKKDLHNKRNLALVESKIRRLVKYYKKQGRIPQSWKYSLQTAKLEVE